LKGLDHNLRARLKFQLILWGKMMKISPCTF